MCNYDCAFVKTRTVQLLREMENEGKGKNDSIDSYVIARCIREKRYQTINKASKEFDSLRHLTRTREELVNNMTRQKNRIIGWLDVNNPIFLEIFKKFTGQMALLILQKYPTPKDLLSTDLEDVHNYLRSNMKRVSIKTVNELVERCKECGKEQVEITSGSRIEIQLYLDMYTFLNHQIEQLDEHILEEARRYIEGFKYIEEIEGMAKISAVSIIAELGDIESFKAAKQVLNFAGLNLKEYSSGLHKGQTKISKSGSRHIRKHIYMITNALVVGNKDFRTVHCYYKAYKRENENAKMEMLIATSCKVLKVMFGILKNNKPFDRVELFKTMDFSKCDMNEFNKEFQGKRYKCEITNFEELSVR